jgi:hypothetical protein
MAAMGFFSDFPSGERTTVPTKDWSEREAWEEKVSKRTVRSRKFGRFVLVPDTDDGDVVDVGAREEGSFESGEVQAVSIEEAGGERGRTYSAGGTWKPLTCRST